MCDCKRRRGRTTCRSRHRPRTLYGNDLELLLNKLNTGKLELEVKENKDPEGDQAAADDKGKVKPQEKAPNHAKKMAMVTTAKGGHIQMMLTVGDK